MEKDFPIMDDSPNHNGRSYFDYYSEPRYREPQDDEEENEDIDDSSILTETVVNNNGNFNVTNDSTTI